MHGALEWTVDRAGEVVKEATLITEKSRRVEEFYRFYEQQSRFYFVR